MKPRTTKPCGNPECGTSTGICDSITHGWGELNSLGYWEFPCQACADFWREKDKGVYAHWPYRRIGDKYGTPGQGAITGLGEKYFGHGDGDISQGIGGEG